MDKSEETGLLVLAAIVGLAVIGAQSRARRTVSISGSSSGGGTSISTPWGSYKQGPGGFSITLPNLGGPSGTTPDPGLASPAPSPDYGVQDPTAPDPVVPADALPDYGAGVDGGTDLLTPDLISSPPLGITPDPAMFVDSTTSFDAGSVLAF
jgi:hypothetical protein